MSTWNVYARDGLLQRQGEIDDFADLEAIRRWNDIGSWTLTIDRRSPMASILRDPGAGIIITRDDSVWMSGPWTKAHHAVKNSQEVLELSGSDDNIWLRRRQASPSPTESVPPYTIQSYDVRTGIASTILRQYVNMNLGPGAAGVRKRPEVTLGIDPAVGSTVTGRARWQVLLTMLQELATTGDAGFNLVQSGANLEFQTFAAIDRTATVRFSRDIGNLAEFEYEESAPEANYFYVGGGGEGTARVLFEKSDAVSIAGWGRIEGEFVDRRDTSTASELSQAADEAFSGKAAKNILTATLIDTPQATYGTDYDLGTKVSVELDNPGSTDVVQDLIRRVKLKGDENGFVITPAVGPEGTQDGGLQIWGTVRELRDRVINLERR